jgi:tripartite-type tricarboxylate transporter receptor subunit TctC
MIARRALPAALAVAFVCAARPATALEYPLRPITIVVPASAGGMGETILRGLNERMRVSLGQPVIIENVGGASGTIAVGRVARAVPDGYTLVLGNWSTQVANGIVYKLRYDLVRDFDPITLIAKSPLLIVARKSMPADDLKQLIAWLRANPDKASQGTNGPGSIMHMAGILFQKETATRFSFVPYRGAAASMNDLLAGQIDFAIGLPSEIVPQFRAGTIKAFAVTARNRLAAAPDVPTVIEAGLPGLDISAWNGLFAPKGTPNLIIAKLNAAIIEALAEPRVRTLLAEFGQELPSRDEQTPEALGSFQKAEVEKWWPIIKATGITAE